MHAADLRTNITALDAQLVDLTLSDVSPLLSLIQLVLQLAELSKVDICLFLLLKLMTEQESYMVTEDRSQMKKSFFHTYSFLRRSLVGFNFQLKLINQILKSGNILAVLLSLLEIQDKVSISFVKLPHMQTH